MEQKILPILLYTDVVLNIDLAIAANQHEESPQWFVSFISMAARFKFGSEV